jgi:hypothetical protein
MSMSWCEGCEKRIDTDFVEFQQNGSLYCDNCLDEMEMEPELGKVYVKTDGPVPEYLTAGKVYEAHEVDSFGFEFFDDDDDCRYSNFINSAVHGVTWTLCGQHGNPVAEQRVAHEAESQMGDLSLVALDRDRYKALAGELAEALGAVMEAETYEAWRYPTVWRTIEREARAALARYKQEKGV